MTTNITLYTKGYCPYCHRAKKLLTSKGVSQWEEFDLEVVPEKYDEMVSRSNGGYTVPQIFIDGKHIGGSDELVALDRAGKLDKLLNLNVVA